jgi:hypothetical protein
VRAEGRGEERMKGRVAETVESGGEEKKDEGRMGRKIKKGLQMRGKRMAE